MTETSHNPVQDPSLLTGNTLKPEALVISGKADFLSQSNLAAFEEDFKAKLGGSFEHKWKVSSAVRLAGNRELGSVEVNLAAEDAKYFVAIESGSVGVEGGLKYELIPLSRNLLADKAEDEYFTIGRNVENDAFIKNELVSSTHAKIKLNQDNGNLIVESQAYNPLFIIETKSTQPSKWERAAVRQEAETIPNPIISEVAELAGSAVMAEVVEPSSTEKAAAVLDELNSELLNTVEQADAGVESTKSEKMTKQEAQMIANILNIVGITKQAVANGESSSQEAYHQLLELSGKTLENPDLSEEAKRMIYALDTGMLENHSLQLQGAEYLSLTVQSDFAQELMASIGDVQRFRSSMPEGYELQSAIDQYVGQKLARFLDDPKTRHYAMAYIGTASSAEVGSQMLSRLINEMYENAS